jgi:hypothetical protein
MLVAVAGPSTFQWRCAWSLRPPYYLSVKNLVLVFDSFLRHFQETQMASLKNSSQCFIDFFK